MKVDQLNIRQLLIDRPPHSPRQNSPPMKTTSQSAGAENLKIYWDKAYSYRTDHFVDWCHDNPTKHVKLFTDSTEDARDAGHAKQQLRTTRNSLYEELAKYVFEHDAELSAVWAEKPTSFVAAIQCCHNMYV